MKNDKILFFFNHKAEHDINEIADGKIPTDRLYGLIELRKMGWTIDVCDERITKTEEKLRKYFLYINLATIFKALRYDTWIVKDQFSLTLTLLAKIFRKKIIYIDSLFHVPHNAIRRLILKINTALAPCIVIYSHYQADLWSSLFSIPKKKFHVLPYSIDPTFYLRGMNDVSNAELPSQKPYILATGRDIARDFHTLVEAAEIAQIQLKIVTLPYLVPENARDNKNVEIFNRISYAELFALYKNALLVAVPLKSGVDYPSGIRAALEAMLVGKPTICTTTPIINEYAPQESNALIYVPAENPKALADAITQIAKDTDYRNKIAANGSKLVNSSFNMNLYAKELDILLKSEWAV